MHQSRFIWLVVSIIEVQPVVPFGTLFHLRLQQGIHVWRVQRMDVHKVPFRPPSPLVHMCTPLSKHHTGVAGFPSRYLGAHMLLNPQSYLAYARLFSISMYQLYPSVVDSEEEAEEVRRQEVHWSVISASSLPCTGLEPPDSSRHIQSVLVGKTYPSRSSQLMIMSVGMQASSPFVNFVL